MVRLARATGAQPIPAFVGAARVSTLPSDRPSSSSRQKTRRPRCSPTCSAWTSSFRRSFSPVSSIGECSLPFASTDYRLFSSQPPPLGDHDHAETSPFVIESKFRHRAYYHQGPAAISARDWGAFFSRAALPQPSPLHRGRTHAAARASGAAAAGKAARRVIQNRARLRQPGEPDPSPLILPEQ